MHDQFEEWRPSGPVKNTLANLVEIIEQYQDDGFSLTLRQLYYQMVARDLIPNTEKSYKRIGSIVSRGRRAGLIDWDAIEDRGRVPDVPQDFRNKADLVRRFIPAYRLDRWEAQESCAEVWVEKQALVGVLEPITDPLHVTLMANRGYSSSSAMYEAANRMLGLSQGRPMHVLYLGDHDPSGLDMVRDIEDRLIEYSHFKLDLRVDHLALTMDQIDEYGPPPNPAKVTDSRFDAYRGEFGEESWELDALEPKAMQDLVKNAIDKLIDWTLWNDVIEQENSDKDTLLEMAESMD